MDTTLIEATVYDNITDENGRAEVLNAIRELKTENERLREALKNAVHEIKMQYAIQYRDTDFETVGERNPVIIAARAALEDE